MFKKNEAAYEKEYGKEHKKFILILCGIVFSFAAFVPVMIYVVNRKGKTLKE